MVLIDGEKFACQSCIKGHRVSGCQHTDRELQHINPKGRPVKQCDHCRGSRKTKSHHARCDCGHKKDKASKSGSGDEHSSGCACHTGAKCLCGSKKDHGLKIETSHKTKPRLTATQSESTLTVFANGHHKPCHRLNNAAHTSGMPYKIPRPHTLHGPPSNYSSDNVHNFYGLPGQQRSMDCLGGLPDINGFSNFNNRPQSGESLPLSPIGGVAESEDFTFDPFKPLFAPMPTSVLGSGSNSPVDGSMPAQTQWTWDAPMGPTAQYGYDGLSTSPSGDFVPNENEWAISSAGLQPSWSAVDLPLHPDKLDGSAVQPISHSGESAHASIPGLSTSSSQSEIGEPHFFGDMDTRSMPHATEPVWEDAMQYRKPRAYRGLSNASTPPDVRQAPTSVPTPELQNRSSLDLEYLRRTSPPHVAESDMSFLPQRPYSNAHMEAVTEEKLPTPNDNAFMIPLEMDNQPRSMGMLSAYNETGSTANPWLASFAEFPPSTFDGTEIPGYTFNDNFS